MRNTIKITAVLSLLFLTSCGVKLKVMNGEHFTKQTTLSIGNYDDKIGTVKEFAYFLKLEGFNVVSPNVASNAVKYKDPFNDITKNEELQKIFNVKDINSIYSIKLNYNTPKFLTVILIKIFIFLLLILVVKLLCMVPMWALIRILKMY